MEKAESGLFEKKTNRVTVRLPNRVIVELQKEADKRDLPLSSLMAKTLNKVASFDMKQRSIPKIIVPELLFDVMLDELPESSVRKIAKDFGPKLARKTMLAAEMKRYDLDSVIENHFLLLAKYCGWFQFDCHKSQNSYVLSFTTKNRSSKWMEFLSIYVQSILGSLKVRIDEKIMDDDTVILHVVKPL